MKADPADPELRDPEEYEVCGYLKVLSNKKNLLPVEEFPEVLELITAGYDYTTRNAEIIPMTDFIFVVNIMQRYYIMIDDEFAKIFLQKLQLFLKDKDKMKIND